MWRTLYSLLLLLAMPLVFVRLFVRGFRQPGYWRNIGERLGVYPQQALLRSLWIHAVSVGELRAAQPLINRLQSDYPGRPIVVTCMTVTGREMASELYGNAVTCVYLPYDFHILHQRFIFRFNPSILIILETEIWPNLLAACRTNNLPAVLVNGRMSEKSLRGYRRFALVRLLVREACQSLHATAAQSSADAARLALLGAKGPVITGNIKFDARVDSLLAARGIAWREEVGVKRRVFLAASTREGEEKMLLDAYREAFPREERVHLLLVLVPRHPQRFDAVHELILAAGLRVLRRSAHGPGQPDVEVWLGDSMGEMAAYIALCDVAFIGGSLLPLGGQNLIEACAQGKPVIMGPSAFNFSDAARLAMEAGAMRQCDGAKSVMQAAKALLRDDEMRIAASHAARAFAGAHAGATEKTMGLIAPLLNGKI